MRFFAIARILGVLLMLFSLSMMPPVGVALYYHEAVVFPFIDSFLVTFFTGFFLWIISGHSAQELKLRDGFLVVVLFWTVLSMFGALPLWLSPHPNVSLIDALFESASGLTTTGSTVLSGLDFLPRAIRYYRQQLQFLGGMGIVVLAVAILPMLGVGGMQLYRAEAPGPTKDNKITPRIAETAKTLWALYTGLTVLCIMTYWWAGMTLFDAVGEGFSTVATGGFAMHDSSFAFYNSPTIHLISMLFMILGATNFGLHFFALKRKSLLVYWQDVEFRVFLGVLCVAAMAILLSLHWARLYPDREAMIVNGLFTVVSMATTTGFTTTHFATWPHCLPYVLLLVALVGGCAGSTSGGIKVLRAILLQKQALRELRRLIHPRAIFVVTLGKRRMSEEVVQSIWGFLSIFIILYFILLLMLLATGVDFTTAFGAITSSLTNVGASIGRVALTYAHLSAASKSILIFAMLAGRLEVFTLLVLFLPEFWRR